MTLILGQFEFLSRIVLFNLFINFNYGIILYYILVLNGGVAPVDQFKSESHDLKGLLC